MPFGPPQKGIEGLTLRGVGGVELDQREVVVGAGVGVLLAVGLHPDPRVVDHGAGLAGAVDLDGRALGQRLAGAAVGRRRGAGAGAVGGLSDVDVRRVVVHEVGRALGAVGVGLHARVDGGAGGGGPGRCGSRGTGCERTHGQGGQGGDRKTSSLHGGCNESRARNLRVTVRRIAHTTNGPISTVRPVFRAVGRSIKRPRSPSGSGTVALDRRSVGAPHAIATGRGEPGAHTGGLGRGRGCRQIADRTSGGVRSVSCPRGPSWRGEHNLPQRRSTVRRAGPGLPGGEHRPTSPPRSPRPRPCTARGRWRTSSAAPRCSRPPRAGCAPPATRSSPSPAPRPGCPRRACAASSSAPPASSRPSPPSCARATTSRRSSTPPTPTPSRSRARTSGACWCPSGRSPCSGPATSRSPSPSPAATPPAPWPPAAPSSSRATRRTPGPARSSRASSRPPPARRAARGHLRAAAGRRGRGRRGARRRARRSPRSASPARSRGGRALFDRASARAAPDPRLRRDGQRQPDRRHRGRAHRARRRDRRGPGRVGRHVRRPAVHEARRGVRAGGRRGRRVHRRRRRQARRARPRGAAQRAPARRADAPASRRSASSRRRSRCPAPPTGPGFRFRPAAYAATAADLVPLPRAARGALRPDRRCCCSYGDHDELLDARRAAGGPAHRHRARGHRATSSWSASSWRC